MKRKIFNISISPPIVQNIENKEILSFKEALVFLDISKSTLYKLTSKNEIPCFRPGENKRLLYFRKSDLEAYLMNNYNGWTPPKYDVV